MHFKFTRNALFQFSLLVSLFPCWSLHPLRMYLRVISKGSLAVTTVDLISPSQKGTLRLPLTVGFPKDQGYTVNPCRARIS